MAREIFTSDGQVFRRTLVEPYEGHPTAGQSERHSPCAGRLFLGRGVWFRGKRRDVVDRLRLVLVHAPAMSAGAEVVREARTFAQIEGLVPRACRTRRNRHLEGKPAPMLPADTHAPVFNDEEIGARTTTQVHKLAGQGYRFDVGGLAFWAGCDRATTLVAGARHVGNATFPARNVPAEPQTIRAKFRGVGSACMAEVVGSDPFRHRWAITHGRTRGGGGQSPQLPGPGPRCAHAQLVLANRVSAQRQ